MTKLPWMVLVRKKVKGPYWLAAVASSRNEARITKGLLSSHNDVRIERMLPDDYRRFVRGEFVSRPSVPAEDVAVASRMERRQAGRRRRGLLSQLTLRFRLVREFGFLGTPTGDLFRFSIGDRWL